MRRSILSLVELRIRQLYLSFLLLQDDVKVVPLPKTQLYVNVPENLIVFNELQKYSDFIKCQKEKTEHDKSKILYCVSSLWRSTDSERVYTFAIDVRHDILQTLLPVNWSNNYTYTEQNHKLETNNLQKSKLASSLRESSAHTELSSQQIMPVSRLEMKRRYRTIIQNAFFANALLSVQSPSWKRALAAGRYELTQLQTTLHVKKYRALNKRYSWTSQLSSEELLSIYQNDVKTAERATFGLTNRESYGYDDDDTNDQVNNNNNDEHSKTESKS